MPDPLAGLPPRFLRTPEAARYLGLSGRTLEKHRTYGTGPKYRKIGGRVVYALDDLKAWADLGAKTSTSDPGVATVYPAKRSAAPGQLRRNRIAADDGSRSPAYAAPEHWQHVHNRLSVDEEPRRYTHTRHQAWLRRRGIAL